MVLVGAAAMFDLRLLSVSRRLPVTAMARHLLPWAHLSLVLVVPSGLMMFAAHATELAENPAFRLKLVLIGAALLNAAAFHTGAFTSVGTWNQDAKTPTAAKLAAVFSLVFWTGVITCGRLLAYF